MIIVVYMRVYYHSITVVSSHNQEEFDMNRSPLSLFCFYMMLSLSLFLTAGTSAFADCPDGTWACAKINKSGNVTNTIVGHVTGGKCWKWSSFSCEPCNGYAKLAEECNGRFYNDCKPYGCAACGEWGDTGGVAGPCYDYLGNKLCEGPASFP